MKISKMIFFLTVLANLATSRFVSSYDSIPLSEVPPFYATRCGGSTSKNYVPNLVFYMDKSGSMGVGYAQNPGPGGNNPTSYNGGAGVENLFWNKWSNYVFHMTAYQGRASFQVPLEIITNLSYGTADTDLAAAGLAPTQISTLRTSGRYNPAGDANMFFTGRWVYAQRGNGWVTPLQRPINSPGPGTSNQDCWEACSCRCYERWLLANERFDLDGPDTALVTPAPANIHVAKWTVINSVKSRPTLRQNLVVYPKYCDVNGKCFAGVIFTRNDSQSTKISKVRALDNGSGSTPMANGLEEILRWLDNGVSYNHPAQTYCAGTLPCSPLDYPGDPESPVSILMLGDGQNWNDCRIPSKQANDPYSGEPQDFDNDGGHDALFPDYDASGHCPEGTTNNWLADDMAFRVRTIYPKATINTVYMGNSAIYGDNPTTCLGGDIFCQYNKRIAQDMPAGVTPVNNNYIATRWGGVEGIINQVVNGMTTITQNVDVTLPSFGGTCSTFVASRSDWLIPITDMADYTAKLYRIKPTSAAELAIPPANSEVLWELGSILRSTNVSTLTVKTTLDGKNVVDFSANDSALIADLSADDSADPTDPDWSTDWTTPTEIGNAIDYIRGASPAGLRSRGFPEGSVQVTPWPLGEIFTPPLVVGPPKSGMSECFGTGPSKKCYSDYANTNKDRTPVVIVATGDGQLRILNYNTGNQLYSFIPKAALQALSDFPKTGYTRTSYVAGAIQAFDVYDDHDSTWKTVLLAGMAQGGNDYFALDITNPSNIKFMFEVNNAALGNSFSPVVSVRLKDQILGEKFVFVAGSGYNNAADDNGSTAQIIAFDLQGNVLKTVKVSDQLGNGTTSVYAQDANDDGTMDALVLGTYKGELIEVKTPGTDFANWGVSRTLAEIGRPITAPIRMNRIEGQRYYFGVTGKLLTDDDMVEDPPPQEYFFAFRDTGTPITLDDLTNYSSTYHEYDDKDDTTPNPKFITVTPDAEQNKVGYKITLPAGHRGISPVISIADGVMFPTTNPIKDSQCTYGGRSLTWYVSQKLNPQFANQKGDAIPYLDVTGDGKIDSGDVFTDEFPVAKETTSATFNLNPQIDMKKATIDVVTVELYSNIKAADGIYYATVGHTIFQNRLRGIEVNWKESTKIKQ